MATYTTTGETRGPCGHEHATIAAARRCIDQDRTGGRTDRDVLRLDTGEVLGFWTRDDDEENQS